MGTFPRLGSWSGQDGGSVEDWSRVSFPVLVVENTKSPSTARRPLRVVVLGSTGSIGTNCLEVIAGLPERLQVVGLSAHASWEAFLNRRRFTGHAG